MPLIVPIEFSDEQLDAIAERVAAKMGNATPNPLTVAEFAKAVGESRSTINAKVKARIIVPREGPGTTRIPYSELERYRSGK